MTKAPKVFVAGTMIPSLPEGYVRKGGQNDAQQDGERPPAPEPAYMHVEYPREEGGRPRIYIHEHYRVICQ
jgi:hypothetical protein